MSSLKFYSYATSTLLYHIYVVFVPGHIVLATIAPDPPNDRLLWVYAALDRVLVSNRSAPGTVLFTYALHYTNGSLSWARISASSLSPDGIYFTLSYAGYAAINLPQQHQQSYDHQDCRPASHAAMGGARRDAGDVGVERGRFCKPVMHRGLTGFEAGWD
ncbi:hypothetical protein C8R45DRAFT_1099463 [Mycena sanguinolenta]|nr:hypothetical protein C8R45DRAFT_1099463 [Mycena sanguinolenta]